MWVTHSYATAMSVRKTATTIISTGDGAEPMTAISSCRRSTLRDRESEAASEVSTTTRMLS